MTRVCYDSTHYDGSKCPICIEEFKDGEVVFMTGCNHRMHQYCSSAFLSATARPKCPACREDVEVFTVYSVTDYIKPGSSRAPITVGDSAETAIKVDSSTH